MKNRVLARALSAAVVTTVVSAGALVGGTTSAAAEPPAPEPAVVQLAEQQKALDLLGALTQDPVLLGTGLVGEPLSLVKPVFGLLSPLLQGLITTDVTWLCDGKEIPGVGDVLQFVPSEAQQGCEIAARTVSSLLGLVPLSLVTNVIPVASSDVGEGEDLPGSLLDVLTQGPQLLGTGNIGDPLSLVEPVFELLSPLLQSLISTDITWLCDGVAIPGVGNVTSFVPTEAQAGCQIAVQTVSTLLGLLPLSLVTDIIPIPGGVVGAPKATTAASIAGTPKVGETLTVTDPVWDTDGVTNTYAWIRNGTPIAGATATTYQVTAADAGKQITARVTGTKAGKSGTSVSNALLISTEAVEQLAATVAPRITGTPRLGRVLRIDPGSWLGGLVSPLFEYQWYSSAGPIPGATAREYVPRLADAGRPIAAVVVARLTGFLDGLAVTNVVKVPKAGTRTRLAKAGARLLRLRVTPAAARPTGKVRLVQRSKVLRTVRLKAADNGRRTVRLPKLRRGTHKIRAVYLGNKALKRSSSKPVRVRVR